MLRKFGLKNLDPADPTCVPRDFFSNESERKTLITTCVPTVFFCRALAHKPMRMSVNPQKKLRTTITQFLVSRKIF